MFQKSRVQNIFSHCNPEPDVILLKNSSDPFIDKTFYYVTNLSHGLFEGCAVLLFPDGNIHLLVSNLECDLAREASSNISIFTTSHEFFEQLHALTSSCNTIGIPFQKIVHSDILTLLKYFPSSSLQDVTVACTEARMRKDLEELSRIEKACTISDRVMEQIPQFIHKGITESELAAEIDYHLQRFGAQSIAFETISSFGKHTALPHYSHGTRVLQHGDFILCDFGACVDKYNADMTRTFIYGRATELQKQMHRTVLDAQRVGIDAIHPGIIANQVHKQVAELIDHSEFANRFIHATGHSLGLDTHDNRIGLNAHCNLLLDEGMVLTVEPGVYLPMVGGVRIEDDILVTSDGCKCLTTSNRELIEV